MKFVHTIMIMFIGSFFIQYFLMPPIMIYKNADITNNFGKFYMSCIMGLFMILLEVFMKDGQYKTVSFYWYFGISILLILFIYFYRKQVAINDKQYVEGMIEHHSMAILTSKQILEKTSNYNVIKLAKNIIQQQEDEITKMREMKL